MKKRLIYNNYETINRGIDLYQIEKIFFSSDILPQITSAMIYNTTPNPLNTLNPTANIVLGLASLGKKYYFTELLDIPTIN